MYSLEQSYDKDFVSLMTHLKETLGEELFDVDGIGNSLDMNAFSKAFFKASTTADVSADSNSNVSDKSVISYDIELAKPFQRLNSYYMLWKESKKLYGLKTANDIIYHQLSGDIYINDLHGIGAGKFYCMNYSMYDVMTKGLPMIHNPKSGPPKSLYAFISHVEQFAIIAANSSNGATGLADIFIVMSYYVKRILETGKDLHFTFDGWSSGDKELFKSNVMTYVKESITSLIYTLNQPLRSNQSIFSNVSIYDDAFLESMCADYIFPDGSSPDTELIKEIQEIFLQVMNDELSRTVFTFPVTTACFGLDDDGNLIKGSLFHMLPKYAKKYSYVNIYAGKSSTLSSCCFDGKQKVLTKSSNGVKLTPIKDICQESGWKEYRKNLTVFHNGSWQKAKRVEIPYNKQMYKIETVNNKILYTTEDHINLTLLGDKKSNELTTDDYLAFNTRQLNTFPEADEKLTYEQGLLIGMYLGDGSKYKRKDEESYTVTFSMNEDKVKHLGALNKALEDWGVEETFGMYTRNKLVSLVISSKTLYDIIGKYVDGKYAHNKAINMHVLTQSIPFRQGICDGWYATDGGNSNRIYTVSEELAETGEALFTSLGYNTIIDVNDRRGKVEINGEMFNRNYPTICLRWYSKDNKLKQKGVHIIKNNTEYYKIKSIEKYDNPDGFVYCFEMDDKDNPYFTLPNGVITHNCRLRSDTANEYFNSFGSGSSKIGSLGVVTLNLPRLAETARSQEEFFDRLEYLTGMACRINNAKRHIIKKRMAQNANHMYTYGFADIDKQYSTVGINGLNECIDYLGENILEESGINLTIDVLKAINKTNDKFARQYKVPSNCEQVPKMCGDVKSYLIDLECHENMVDKGQARQFINVCAA